MKSEKEIKKMEVYLEKNASKLVETNDDVEFLIKAAKVDVAQRKKRATTLQKLRKEKLKLT